MIIHLFFIEPKMQVDDQLKDLCQTRVGSEYRVGSSAIAEFPAIESSRWPFYPLAANPLENVRSAIPQFDFLVLAIAQKTN
jgi:hypothetical protein